MPDLVAQGKNATDQWRRTLPEEEITLGRDPEQSDWDVPWDMKISRSHALLSWRDGKLMVRRSSKARNPVYFNGQSVNEFSLVVGQRFHIGETHFTLHDGEPTPASELTCNAQDLIRVRYADPGERLEALAALPTLIRQSPSDQELANRVLDVLLQGISRADSAAVVYLNPSDEAARPEIAVRAVKARASTQPGTPSRKLVVDALRSRQYKHYTWDGGAVDIATNLTGYTVAGCDWAFCVPLPDASGLGLYVAGRNMEATLRIDEASRQEALRSDMKFADLTAGVFSALRKVNDLQQRQAELNQFFPPAVMQALIAEGVEQVLQPREADVTVLFCDLRGSCLITDDGAADLQSLWERISAALDVMASSIAEQGGVIGDFQGDGVMGFWGWPIACEERALQAARAALNIRKRFMQKAKLAGNPLSGFACGVGLASGRAIAGRLGAADLFKIDVFGPVVNLAARLEGMTKVFVTPIVMDELTADLLKKARAGFRQRQLARVLPFGMRKPLLVSELLPAIPDPGAMPEPDRLDYEAALKNFFEGRWSATRDLLQRLPTDAAGKLLLDEMDLHPAGPPTDWAGIIKLSK